MLAKLIILHLVGDFLLQNHWMQQKGKSDFVCMVHVACYAIPFVLFTAFPMWFIMALLSEHYLQDRYALHLKWMKLYKQTTPDLWPVGPLCMDQSFHLAFIAILAAFLP